MGLTSSKQKRSSPEEVLAGLMPVKQTPLPEPPQPTLKPTRIISLDGNIGVGKTTLIEHIRKRFPDIVIVPEPVDMWTQLKDEKGRNLLELFYKDKQRWSFSFQQAAMLSRRPHTGGVCCLTAAPVLSCSPAYSPGLAPY